MRYDITYTPNDNTRWLVAVLLALVIFFGVICYVMPPDPSDGEDFEESSPGGYYIDVDDDDDRPSRRAPRTNVSVPYKPGTRSPSRPSPSPKSAPSPKSSPGRSSGSSSRSR